MDCQNSKYSANICWSIANKNKYIHWYLCSYYNSSLYPAITTAAYITSDVGVIRNPGSGNWLGPMFSPLWVASEQVLIRLEPRIHSGFRRTVARAPIFPFYFPSLTFLETTLLPYPLWEQSSPFLKLHQGFLFSFGQPDTWTSDRPWTSAPVFLLMSGGWETPSHALCTAEFLPSPHFILIP